VLATLGIFILPLWPDRSAYALELHLIASNSLPLGGRRRSARGRSARAGRGRERRDVLLAELLNVIAYYKGQIRMSQALLKAGGIRETEAKASIAKYGEELG
jgi:hypothetical protein